MNAIELAKQIAAEFAGQPDERPRWLSAIDQDPTSVYYRYFFELTRKLQPRTILEIGTAQGGSGAHLAAGFPGATLLTLDIMPQAKASIERLGLPNVVAIVRPALDVPGWLKWMPPIDLLFIDGDHTFRDSYREYLAFRPFVRDGGLIFFDDVHLNPDMDRLWRTIPDPKSELNNLHYTGFGVAAKDPSITPTPMEILEGVLR